MVKSGHYFSTGSTSTCCVHTSYAVHVHKCAVNAYGVRSTEYGVQVVCTGRDSLVEASTGRESLP